MKHSNLVEVLRKAGCAVALLSGSVFATDYTWLANPESGDWLTGVNWLVGGAETAWTAGSGNTATFGASATKDVDVDGSVAVSTLTVNDDYSFTNGTLTVEGNFSVAAGKTATVESALQQTSSSTRFAKTGSGTLVVNGDASHTNSFYRFAARGGNLVLDGGEYRVTGASSGAGESAVAVSLCNSGTFTLKGGANFVVDVSSSYLSNSGCDMLVTNATFDCFRMTEFLHGFQDNIVNNSERSMLTIADGGTFVAKQLRLAKLAKSSSKTNYGRTYLKKGGTLVLHNFSMDSQNNYKASIDFDGGYLVPTNSSSSETTQTTINMTSTGGSWPGVDLNILEGGFWLRPQARGYWYFNAPFKSGCECDGGIHVVDSKNCTTYFYATNSTYTGGLWLHGAQVAVNNDRGFGAVPSVPTNNIFAVRGPRSSSVLHFGDTFDVSPMRRFYVDTNNEFQVGAAANKTGRIKGTIFGEPNSIFKCAGDWTGTVALDPGADRTNTVGKLYVAGNLVLESGTTVVTSNSVGNAQNGKEALYVYGNGSSFSGTKGRLILAGGDLKTIHDHYLNVEHYGEAIITNGHLDASTCREWLNALASPGRTFVGGKGKLSVQQVRITQVTERDANGDPLSGVTLSTGGVIRTQIVRIDQNQANRRGYFAFDGGTLVKLSGSSTTLIGLAKSTTNAERWTNQQIRVCSGGAVVDTDGREARIYHPLWSWAEHDGGLTKKGTGTLKIMNEADWPDFNPSNTYNGVTRVEAGTLEFTRAEGGFPGGDLEIVGPALTNAAPPQVVLPQLVFREGHGLRIADADRLDSRTFGRLKTFATFTTTPLASVPPVSFVAADGTVLGSSNGWKGWHVKLADGGRALVFGPLRGTMMICR